MYSKEESARIRKEFWTSFGKSFPRKWLLYNTKIKDFSFKFVADYKKAMVCLDIEPKDELYRAYYYDKIRSLKNILQNNYIKDLIFDENYTLDNGKIISRIYTKMPKKFNIHNKNTWRDAYEFFVENMSFFEDFFYEYQEYIKD